MKEIIKWLILITAGYVTVHVTGQLMGEKLYMAIDSYIEKKNNAEKSADV